MGVSMIFQVDQIILLSSERSIVELDTYIWISIEQWGYRSRLYLVQWAVFTVSYLRVSELQEHSRAQDPEYIESLTTLHQCYFFFHNTKRTTEMMKKCKCLFGSVRMSGRRTRFQGGFYGNLGNLTEDVANIQPWNLVSKKLKVPELLCLKLVEHSTRQSGTGLLLLTQHGRKSCVRLFKSPPVDYFVVERQLFIPGDHFVHFKLVRVGAEKGCRPIGQG